MIGEKKIRVMWLLNHTSARKFEVQMLKKIGINEIFLPKIFPKDPNFRSASIDYSEDENLTIPKEDLTVLNNADWYSDPGPEAWEIANKYFDIIFFILWNPEVVCGIVKHFRGSVLLRAYGMPKETSYSSLLDMITPYKGRAYIKALGDRFWFAEAYRHLHCNEHEYIGTQNVYLPLGLHNASINDNWQGNDRKVLFICPDIGCNPYYRKIYVDFLREFKGFPYSIGGAQPIRTNDPNVSGFLPIDMHEERMRQMRVMFYHSTEPNHIHYHPFEAIRAGMPLVFMAGGMLDRLGGKNLPGRCKTIAEARRKIKKILNDDWSLIEEIRNSQTCLLEPMRPENCEGAWQEGFSRILEGLERSRKRLLTPDRRQYRIVVFIPVGYRGGSLRAAKLLAQAIDLGSRQASEPAEVILAHLDNPSLYPDEEFNDLPTNIKRRPFWWRVVDSKEAYRAMVYAGLDYLPMESASYQIPDDGINQFLDCDLWVVVSDRLEHPLLPLRPYVLVVYDYLQRYIQVLSTDINAKFIASAHVAERVMVTTEFTRGDAVQFAGIPERKIVKVPMLAPHYWLNDAISKPTGNPRYFLWTTNLAPHKNHVNAFKALLIYYEEYGGRLECCISGVNTENILKSKEDHLKPLKKMLMGSKELRNNVKVLGELPEQVYRSQLSLAAFLWHPALIDTGTFSVIEAAALGVPALSSDYPAMREIDTQFDLNLRWMDPYNPEDMARQLKYMEREAQSRRNLLPTTEKLAMQSLENVAGAYWEAVRACL
ncbi:glycosyl transferase, group 1 [Desulforamulus reducens MI-1]|uniref:Glycosyl transferase, group 1 n=2 Tax=Desulforamulus TaxID=2916693 RepID=A4J979_DESRM|nr:glycosyl transferase, group 1 [Desulforamulus reducens MI-1]